MATQGQDNSGSMEQSSLDTCDTKERKHYKQKIIQQDLGVFIAAKPILSWLAYSYEKTDA